MKLKHPRTKHCSRRAKFLALSLGLSFAALSQSAQAANYFWDENGATAGFGTAGTSGVNYSSTTSLLSTDQTGSTAPTGTQTSGTLDTDFFGTAAAGLGAGTITISGTVSSSNYTFASASGAITLGGTGSISLGTTTQQTYVAYNALDTISAVLIGGNSTNVLQIGNSATSAIAGAAAGNGTIVLSGANTFDRAITINTGKLSVATVGGVGSTSSNLGAPTTAATAQVNLIGGGTLLYTGAGETSNRVVNLSSGSGSGGVLDQSGTGTLVFSGGVTSSGASSKTLTLQGSTAGTGQISGVIADNSTTNLTSISKTGTGTWVLSGANTYSGTNTVNGGVLSVSNIGNVGGTSSNLGAQTTAANGQINVLGGGTLLYTGAGETSNRVVNLSSGSGTGGTIDQSGTGTLVFSGGVTSSGASSKTLTFQGSTAGTGVVSGVIANNSTTALTSVTKTGTGTWTFSGTNTYTGTTTVNAGTLLINGDNSAATGNVAVNAGTLGGAGTVGGMLTVAANANLSPGATAGAGSFATLRTTGALTLNSTANFNVDLANATAGTGYDQVVTGGAVSLNGSNLVLNVVGAGLNVGDKLFIVDNGSASAVTGTFNGYANGATITAGGDTFTINYFDTGDGTAGNDISLTVMSATAVPEPATWVQSFLMLFAVGYHQRRRLRGFFFKGQRA